MASSQVVEAIAVTAEMLGKVFSPAAARVLAEDLGAYPEPAVLRALVRCRRELTTGNAFTLGAIIARIDDGRPGGDEAWAMLPRDEAATVVWTEDMRQAWAVALPLLNAGEVVAARMAFKEAYGREVSNAREAARPCVWSITPGTDPQQRADVVRAAYQAGRIAGDTAALFLPSLPPTPAGVKLLKQARFRIAGGKQ